MPTQTTKPTRDDDRFRLAWWQWGGLAILVVATIVSVSLLSFVGFGFFFVPIALGALFLWLFVMILRRLDFRNSMTSERPTLSQRYADGQPYDRAMRRQVERPYRDLDERPPAVRSEDEMSDHAP